ncbi:ADP-ribosylation factor-binding protein GGA1-like isoform X2 [Physella acuta]|uniref:ADP-ribosylation factor-binding protein GGA1-like isoform X2 n=1 Tax=Physella acuta TaxID=109671 RepID=UPI0027DD8C24|nr:ADP-ribosylation factor-binding protein GGA1-like isoform X2 [Physella acuta]
MATSDDSLEILLNRATDPSMKEEDWEKITAFCDKVVHELEGPLLSTRLLAHKIQSPQEKEALYALSTLEACVKNCGRYFHQEVGKFRFLNEIIKVVSPKYLGNRTSEKVKKKCIEILYSWYKGLTHEPKIGEAYKMLKAQGIIKEDPTYMDKSFDPFPPPKPRKADFEDDEKAKTLERLLRSKNPEDLQAANRLIKTMVKEDMEKTEKRSRRINELESVGNQVKLLTEMISQYSSNSSKEELEMMKELYDNLEKQRPNLFRLASDTDENDNDGINDILKANDSVTRVMTLYKEKVEGEKPIGDYTVGAKDSSLLDLGLDSSLKSNNISSTASATGLLENDFNSLGLGDMNDLGSIFGSMGQQQQSSAINNFSPQLIMAPAMNMSAPVSQFGTQPGFTAIPARSPMIPSTGMFTGAPPAYSAISHSVRPAVSAPSISEPSVFNSQPGSSLADLDILNKSLQDYNLHKETFPVKTRYREGVVPVKLPLNQLAANKAAASAVVTTTAVTTNATQMSFGQAILQPSPAGQVSAAPANNTDFSAMVSAEPVPELLPLTDIFVPLDKIQPAPNIPSITAYEKNNLKMMVHFAKDRPRADVVTMVISTISTNSAPITGFVFQAAVPKIMKVKLQPPSATDFPAYNPILPPAAITQVMLVANPRKEKVRLKYKLSYILNGDQVSDVGDIDGIPLQ